MSDIKPKVVVICGPTGVGKTAVALEIAEAFAGEIIGADSMQIYRYMDIGTAKPTLDEQARRPYHLIDIVDPDASFDAARFTALARDVILRLYRKKIIPFVVGGTGLYIKGLACGLFKTRLQNRRVRSRLEREAAHNGVEALYQRLKKCDPAAALRIHPNDRYRIIRALEVYEATGETISKHHQGHLFSDRPFDLLKIGLFMDREKLYQRIDKRCDAMITAGFLDEVKSLLKMGYGPDLKPMKAIGYRHMLDFIQASISWDEALRTMKRDTRRYAKRQITWFKTEPEITWIEVGKTKDISRRIKRFLRTA